MVAFWLSGIEDRPERSGEICVAEIFGDAVEDSTAAVGMGLHRFRDPALTEDFATPRLPLDVADFHTYGVDWAVDSLTFSVDGETVRRVDQAPDYPVQLMIGVFDFPAKADPSAGDARARARGVPRPRPPSGSAVAAETTPALPELQALELAARAPLVDVGEVGGRPVGIAHEEVAGRAGWLALVVVVAGGAVG